MSRGLEAILRGYTKAEVTDLEEVTARDLLNWVHGGRVVGRHGRTGVGESLQGATMRTRTIRGNSEDGKSTGLVILSCEVSTVWLCGVASSLNQHL